jgi:SAM-dependent methyltransferase
LDIATGKGRNAIFLAERGFEVVGIDISPIALAEAILETYLIDQQGIGDPKNPDYLLAHNELLELFRDFRVLYYREGQFLQSGKNAFLAGLLAPKKRS